jgi:hypothetical protein
MCCDILKSSATFVGVSSHRSGRNVSGEGKTDASRCIDQACVETMVPGGTAYPMRSKISSKIPFFEVDAGTMHSRRLGAAEYRRRPSVKDGNTGKTRYRENLI